MATLMEWDGCACPYCCYQRIRRAFECKDMEAEHEMEKLVAKAVGYDDLLELRRRMKLDQLSDGAIAPLKVLVGPHARTLCVAMTARRTP